jgi:G3E family GTPase
MTGRDATSRAPIEVILLTGFLGAGKTTLLKHLLAQENDLSGLVVLVNEFGEVGLDGRLLRGSGVELMELTNGCICCSLTVDLVLALRRIAEMSPRRVLIEATGVAEPAKVTQALARPELARLYRLLKVVTVLDIGLWEARSVVGSLFWDQLGQADLVLINKTDTVDSSTLSARMKEMATELPGIETRPTVHCGIPLDIVLNGPCRADQGLILPLTTRDGPPTGPFQSIVFRAEACLDAGRLDAFLGSAPPHLYRIKGVVRFDSGTRFLNYTPGRPDWQEWPDEDPTVLVLIGRDLDEQGLLDGLGRCAL